MPEKIKLIFLGTSDAIPTAKRNHTSILLSYKDENIIIDCGEGTQRQLRKARLNPCRITRILVTHWHGDHILGLPGLIQTLFSSGYKKTLFIYGPKGTKKFVNNLLNFLAFGKKTKIIVDEVEKKFLETPDFCLEAEKMTHSTPCNAYSFIRKGQIKINKEKLKKAGLPPGPWIKQIKNGRDITHEDKRYSAKNLTFSEQGKKISFILDTSLNSRIIPFVKNSDILVCESSFLSDLQEKAAEYYHLTAEQAAQIAKKARAKKLILTHISQRYDKKPELILKEAKKIFKNSWLTKDFDRFEV